MRPLITATAAALLFVLAGCEQLAGTVHPNPIIVREFGLSTGAITLDPSFGFSLYRGTPGVPPRQRAAGVGRAAAFAVADQITLQLQALGYDAIRSDDAQPEPGAKALIVSGTFRTINEGYRRLVGAENAHVAVDVEISSQTAGGAPQRIANLHLDSRQAAREPLVGVSARRGADVNLAASQVGAATARYVAETARLNKWPAASR